MTHGHAALNRIIQPIASGRVERATADLVTPYEPPMQARCFNRQRTAEPYIELKNRSKKESRRTMRKNLSRRGTVLPAATSFGLTQHALQVRL